MPQPTTSDVHVDAALTNISIAYIQDQTTFIADQIFPKVGVTKQSDKYFSYTQADWFRDEAEVRAPDAESAGSGYNVGTDSYFAEVYAIHKMVPDRVRVNADAAINPDRDATQFVTQRLLLRKEIQFNTTYMATSVWSNDVTPANLWSNYATSDPISDVETGKQTILNNTGFEPNTLVLGYQVWRQLKHHPDLVDRFKYTSSDSITEEMLAQILGLDRVLVSKAIKNTAGEGATASYSFTTGKHALLCYVNPNPGLLAPSAGYIFSWDGVSGGMGTDVAITRLRFDSRKSDRIEGEMAWDMKVVAANLGYFFNGAVA